MFLIPFIVVVVFFVLYQKKNGYKFGAVSFVISLYLIMGFSSIVLYVFYDYGSLYSVDISAVFYLSFGLALSFYGMFTYTDKQPKILLIENVKLLRWLEYFQIISAGLALLFFLPLALSALTGDIHQNRLSIGDASKAIGETYGLINSFASLAGNLFFLSIILAFVNLSTLGRGGSRLRAKVLLFLSVVYIVYILAYVGRDGFVYWCFSFIFIYLIFRDFLPEKEARMIKRIALIISAPAFAAFIAITLARFSDGSALLSVFDYAGSQVFNFSDQYNVDAVATFGLLNFGQYIHLVGIFLGEHFDKFDRDLLINYFEGTGVKPWRFSTFIGAWYLDFRRFGTMFVIAILFFCLRLSLRRQRRKGIMTFSNLLFFILLAQIVLFGVFYYRQVTTAYAQITVVLIALIFKLMMKKRSVRFCLSNYK